MSGRDRKRMPLGLKKYVSDVPPRPATSLSCVRVYQPSSWFGSGFGFGFGFGLGLGFEP